MKRRQKRVLIALGWYDYRLHSGIEKYAQEHGWYLSANLAREKVIPWGWEGDGILAWLGAGDDLAEFVQSRKKTHRGLSAFCVAPHLKFPARPGRPRARRTTGRRAFSRPRLQAICFLQRHHQLVLRRTRRRFRRSACNKWATPAVGSAGTNPPPSARAATNGNASAVGSPRK